MFRYPVYSEQQAQESRAGFLLDPGKYAFIIESAEAQQSKSGNPMIKVVLQIQDNMGHLKKVFDYLVFTQSMSWKVRHFAACIGLLEEYEQQRLQPEMCVGKHGSVEIEQKVGDMKPDGTKYPDKNVVADYIAATVKSPLDVTDFEPDKDIPF